MPASPHISVIVPVYNAEAYLEECLRSIQTQTLRNIEIICINDGSPDNSLSILKKMAEADERIVIISHENRGVSACRNEAMQQARGKYLAFMDSDDLYPANDVLEALFNKAEEHQVLVCGGGFADFSEEKPTLNTDFPAEFDGYHFKKEGVIPYADYQFDYGFTRFIYNRQMLLENNIKFPAYTRFEDPPFFVRAMQQAGRFYAISKVTYAYRIMYKPMLLNRQKAEDLFKGIRDNWELALTYNYKKLQEYCYLRIRWHWDMAKEHLEEAENALIQAIERRHIIAKRNLGRWIFSRKKSILSNNLRYITLFGCMFCSDKRKKMPASHN